MGEAGGGVGGGVKVITGQLFHLDGSQAEWHFLCPACASPPLHHPSLTTPEHPPSERRPHRQLAAAGRSGADNGLAYHCRRLAAQLLSNATVTGHEKPY